MLIDAHTPAIEGFFEMPPDHLTAVPLLAGAVKRMIGEKTTVVAADLGAVKLARAYSNQPHVPMAFVHNTRLNGEAVEAHAVIATSGAGCRWSSTTCSALEPRSRRRWARFVPREQWSP
jgi:phosphoribosylpyrophosphate synthetase